MCAAATPPRCPSWKRRYCASSASSANMANSMKKIANFLRLFWGCVFLAGIVINIVIGFTNPHSYDNGGLYAWPDLLQNFWASTVAPHMAFFIILFAIAELILGLSILNKGKLARIGIIGAVFFG